MKETVKEWKNRRKEGYENSGSQGGVYEDDFVLGCYAL